MEHIINGLCITDKFIPDLIIVQELISLNERNCKGDIFDDF